MSAFTASELGLLFSHLFLFVPIEDFLLDRATQAFGHRLLRGTRKHPVSPRSAPPPCPIDHAVPLHRTSSWRTSAGAARASTSTIPTNARHVYTP
ncbi:hypothetical protein F2Q70_00017362 [Brassica cretica]|uniref:Secreted protein n=1 Tax=Brassica cretica TaxID=69181 RepID=A0A8S9HVL1_BRACR|nr:hypothetical protein F2Q70_00017362 [Brassica cretica]